MSNATLLNPTCPWLIVLGSLLVVGFAFWFVGSTLLFMGLVLLVVGFTFLIVGFVLLLWVMFIVTCLNS
jgi:hypothetical protein